MLNTVTKLSFCVIDNRIRENLTRLRREKGFSIQELSRLSGLPYLARVEKGTKSIGKQGVARLAQALSTDISEFYRPLTRPGRAEQLLQVFMNLTPEGQALVIETAKSIAAYEVKLKWRE